MGPIKDPYKDSCKTSEHSGVYTTTHPVQKVMEDKSMAGQIAQQHRNVELSESQTKKMTPETIPGELDNSMADKMLGGSK